MRKNSIYLDYAATTPVDKDVFDFALPYYRHIFYNPSSTHSLGQRAAAATQAAREKCASAINAHSDEIYFTSGGTEAINWAFSAVERTDKRRIVLSAIEHDAANACARALMQDGYAVDYVKPNGQGIITPQALEAVMTDDTALVCIMTVNNIVGSVQPIKELNAVAKSRGALFFTDAVQAVNSLKIDAADWGVDMLAVSAHKFYSVKGAGFLYVKRGTNLPVFMKGGEQERGARGGTSDVPSIAAMGEAIKIATSGRDEYNARIKNVTDEFFGALKFGEPVLCSQKTDDIVSVVFAGINGGRLAVALSCAGLCCSVGSACSAGSATPPKTLTEMGVKGADCAVRFSFGKYTTISQAREAARIVNSTVKNLLRVRS